MNLESRPQTMTSADLARLGSHSLVYVREVLVDGEKRYRLSAADGTELVVAESAELAVAIAKQQGLEPLSVH